ncbi:hypothetical protein K2173_004733 [Erythroxylum novogranatense]|uniref:Classical arabinogalactan protein 26-like n=1 Tax=Erythroxylum novogranatense TaxID=1862640 RepID=A0AAV8U895_9ROSI|nr:hypothetical protein K2173_004733 [Erythroxylum novogranatense]
MASFCSFLAMFIMFMPTFSSLALTSRVQAQFSTIAASPSFLPDAPLSSPPSLSPDMEPLFPAPGVDIPSPAESSLPTIPASPSPPNPDDLLAPGPATAISPTGLLPASSSVSLSWSGPIKLAVFWVVLVLSVMQLHYSL